METYLERLKKKFFLGKRVIAVFCLYVTSGDLSVLWWISEMRNTDAQMWSSKVHVLLWVIFIMNTVQMYAAQWKSKYTLSASLWIKLVSGSQVLLMKSLWFIDHQQAPL